ncbi:AbrB/MazE/SpoVT family DNA-binding domain-containing protein [Candidatus Acetothermia bacterium]|nr:AbrB/MazE/SpoVT family DNA-binding domain-containing protein [Candidatus Acetothermia bacterium]
MAAAKVTSKGQITVPKGVREALGLSAGDELEFVEDAGRFLIRKRVRRSPFDRYLGYLTHKGGQDPDEIVKDLRGRR